MRPRIPQGNFVITQARAKPTEKGPGGTTLPACPITSPSQTCTRQATRRSKALGCYDTRESTRDKRTRRTWVNGLVFTEPSCVWDSRTAIDSLCNSFSTHLCRSDSEWNHLPVFRMRPRIPQGNFVITQARAKPTEKGPGGTTLPACPITSPSQTCTRQATRRSKALGC